MKSFRILASSLLLSLLAAGCGGGSSSTPVSSVIPAAADKKPATCGQGQADTTQRVSADCGVGDPSIPTTPSPAAASGCFDLSCSTDIPTGGTLDALYRVTGTVTIATTVSGVLDSTLGLPQTQFSDTSVCVVWPALPSQSGSGTLAVSVTSGTSAIVRGTASALNTNSISALSVSSTTDCGADSDPTVTIVRAVPNNEHAPGTFRRQKLP